MWRGFPGQKEMLFLILFPQTSSSTLLPFVCSVPAILAFLLILKSTKRVPESGSCISCSFGLAQFLHTHFLWLASFFDLVTPQRSRPGHSSPRLSFTSQRQSLSNWLLSVSAPAGNLHEVKTCPGVLISVSAAPTVPGVGGT